MTTILCHKTQLSKVPSAIGVYIFYNPQAILYIGKSINLKARISSHFENAKIDLKEKAIIENSSKIKLILTDSEFKALILESSLIQKNEPRYNRIWKDGKSYLYIKINLQDQYPKIHAVRKENDGQSLYFGPFHSTRLIRRLLREIRKSFPFCSQNKINKKTCFHAKLNLCNPCPSFIENIADKKVKTKLRRQYRSNIKQIIKIFQGKTDLLLKNLYQKLAKISEKQDFEQAIILRNRILTLERLITDTLYLDQDLSTNHNVANAQQTLIDILKKYYPEVKQLRRIECYDISNLQGTMATGAMVVLEDGMINKSEYRKFKIKTKFDGQSLNSDFEMLRHVILRRFGNPWVNPDLIIVDGGKPQVKLVIKTLNEIKKHMPVLGIAKNPDRLIMGIEGLPTVRLSLNNLGFNLIRLIRDESHRFARKYHLLLRKKKLV